MIKNFILLLVFFQFQTAYIIGSFLYLYLDKISIFLSRRFFSQ